MRIRYIFRCGVTAALLATMSSCTLLEKSQKLVLRGSDAQNTAVSDEADLENEKSDKGKTLTPPMAKPTKKQKETANVSSKKAVKSKKKGDKHGGNASVSVKELNEARREVAEEEKVEKSVAEAGKISADASDLIVAHTLPSDFTINGEWTISSVAGNVVTGEERPYVTFDLAAKRFYGSNGCNYVNGDIVAETQGTLRLTNLITSMRMCEDAPYEYLINLALSEVCSYIPRQEGSVTYLDLNGADGRAVMVLRRHNMEFANGAWRITVLNGTEMKEEASITIDVNELRIHGNTGCNIFNGTIFIDPDKVDSMQFADLGCTRMSCENNVRETELLLALEQVESARPDGKNKMNMYSTDGTLLLTLERLKLAPMN